MADNKFRYRFSTNDRVPAAGNIFVALFKSIARPLLGQYERMYSFSKVIEN